MAEKGLGENELSRQSGVPQSTIHRILTGESKDPRRSNLEKLEQALARPLVVQRHYGIGKTGAMVDPIETSGPSPILVVAERNRGYLLEGMAAWDDATPLDTDDVEIPLFKEVEMAAGAGHTHQIEINGRKLRFSKATLKAAGVDIANAACATVSGNSMERLIPDGATIGVDRGRTQIRDGEIYAIDHDGMLRVKYLYRMPGGGLRLRSENSSEHPDEMLTQEQAQRIRVLGWVFWWSTLRTWGGR